MHAAVRVYNSDRVFHAIAGRAGAGLQLQLERMEGFRLYLVVSCARFGLVATAFDTAGQLEASLTRAQAWGQEHLADLLPAAQPSELLFTQVLSYASRPSPVEYGFQPLPPIKHDEAPSEAWGLRSRRDR